MHSFDLMLGTHLVLQSVSKGEKITAFAQGWQQVQKQCKPEKTTKKVVCLSVQSPLHLHSSGVMQGTEVRRSLC